MLSLSLFSSSQTISLAVFNEKKLVKLIEKKIINNRIESIFEILSKCLKKFEINVFSKIFFSTGPGSFTALRSIKAISQALALSSNAQIYTTSSFSPLLSSIKIKDQNILACFKSTNNKFFYQVFEKSGKIFKTKYEINYGDETQLTEYYFERKKEQKNLLLLSSERLRNFNKNEIKPLIKKVDASHLGMSIFLGYGSKKTSIFYHNTYYEKN